MEKNENSFVFPDKARALTARQCFGINNHSDRFELQAADAPVQTLTSRMGTGGGQRADDR